MRPGPHLDEKRLVELFAQTLGQSPSTQLGARSTRHPHLAVCESCAARFANLVRALQEHADETCAEADRVFSTDRLARQCERILQRIDAGSHLARVLQFPIRAMEMGAPTLRRAGRAARVSRRWVAAAAAAGLVFGLSMGRLWPLPSVEPPPATSSSVQARPNSGASSGVAATHPIANEEALLDEIEAILVRQPAPELHALDAFTPRIQDVALNLR